MGCLIQGVHVREGEGAGFSWKEDTEAIMSDGLNYPGVQLQSGVCHIDASWHDRDWPRSYAATEHFQTNLG